MSEKLVGLLRQVREACLYTKDDGTIGVSDEAQIDCQLFGDICQSIKNYEAEVKPVAPVSAIRFIYVEDGRVSPDTIVSALQDGELTAFEAIEWIEKLIRHNMAPGGCEA